MLSRIHDKLGTAGLVVAVIALVAALAGTAFAAAGLNSTQKKEVKKIAKQFAGKPGATGATGPAGAQGPKGDTGAAGKDGTNGTNGNNGTNGTSAEGTPFTGSKTVGSVTCTEGGIEVKSAKSPTAVCNGVKGTTGFTETLPTGKTETGSWSFVSHGAGEFVLLPLSFNIPLTEAPEALKYNGPGEVDTTNCPGTLTEPKALPGKLCVYPAGPGVWDETTEPEGNQHNGAFANLWTSGATMAFITHAASKVIYGTYAVTAK